MNPNKFEMHAAQEGHLPDPAFERDLEYVKQKTENKRLLSRADIVPSELKDILPEVAFLTPLFDETGRVYDASVQLEGSKIVAFYGEHTGHSIVADFDADVSMRIVAAMSDCVMSKRPVFAELRLAAKGRRNVVVRSLYIPLSENGVDVDRCFVHFRIQFNDPPSL